MSFCLHSDAKLETEASCKDGFMQVNILVEDGESSAQGPLQSVSDAWPWSCSRHTACHHSTRTCYTRCKKASNVRAAALCTAQCMHPERRSLLQEILLLQGSNRPLNIHLSGQECMKK